jgi:hypothetical protein
MPQPKRWEGYSSHICSRSWLPQGHGVKLRPKVHNQVLVSLVESHGFRAQDEHLIPTPNEWTNRDNELGYPTTFKELCGNKSTRLGGPFGVG